ncbi:helix-turn-helix transcriptional regulator [Paenibacillus sp. 453mf]|uniref:helix-turn-helix domain-containing protein n=1 Tax=Paenibacillus sp. 453mf TaxID=1761874 RepID=UPI0008EC5DE7|nr:helix-turn-helix transcriptional regulator [Paenibacillus sp. 453mf]SFS76151.1 Cro/C1-type HTH DNA-binding domain-containing protein [Paenibacillus sp. 453mf]
MSEWNKKKAILQCNLGNILKEKEISALKLSKDLDYRRSTINDLVTNREMEHKRIPATLIARLCVYLEITPNDLFTVTYE